MANHGYERVILVKSPTYFATGNPKLSNSLACAFLTRVFDNSFC